ncbi:MAG TPA: SPFH domain-containing protein, partial [Ignavibacteriaceae bacterium]
MEIFIILSCVIIFVFAVIFLSTFFIVKQHTVAVIQNFGRFSRIAKPGLNFKIPFVENIAGSLTMRIQQLDVKAETKTKDNVFVHITVSVQYFVKPDKVYEAFYRLENPEMQINSYVFDVIRARVPRIEIDRLFEEKEEIAKAIKEELNETMTDFGFEIMNSLVT